MVAINWDEHAVNWENSEVTATYAKKAFESLQQFVNLHGKHVLDFGCGTGLLSQKMSPIVKDIVALDSSEAMIEQLDDKQLDNVEPVVDLLTRGLVAIHPAFRNQFELVVASSVCGFISNYADVCDIIYTILDDGGYFVHWDWLVVDDAENSGMSFAHAEQVLTSVGFREVSVSVPFSITTPEGELDVLMAIAKK